MKRKIMMIVNYYYPDIASGAQLMKELTEEIQDEFDLTVLAAIPGYSGNTEKQYEKGRVFFEKYKDINVMRVWVPKVDKNNKLSRLKYMISYFFNSIVAILKSGKQDVIFAISQPPIIGGLLGVIAKKIKKAKLIYNIQDFTPEVVEAIGYSKSKLLIKLARKIDNYSCSQSDTVLVVGRDMLETIEKRFGEKHSIKTAVINNWVDEKEIYPLDSKHEKIINFKKKYDLEDKVVFMYSGNIGLYYDLINILKVIEKFKDNKDIVFAFIGDGAVKKEMEEYAENKCLHNVKFIPYQKKEDLIYSLNAADIHIVNNAKGIKGVSVPSKIYGVMATGKSVLGILEEGSEARLLIEESNCGICCEPGNYELIEKNIAYMINNSEKYLLNGRKYLEHNLRKKDSIDKYVDLFSNINL
ncbi:glycosyltransferase family 4 protein [Clostridium sp.]|jgi:glycosyltransferase, group 1 family|uniref:glycosyltransferase family 4 protein n=1 Tax=Clostridium sp. TaxID=1506 RepID=UPI0025DCED2F|nr:glycosyltransferase family 4 protein [Clostridium sp.]MDY2630719.1 glycosyltransferase family 4 protein [Clostridium sp.]